MVYHRWVLIPMVEYTDEDENYTAPKYLEDEYTDQINGYPCSLGPFDRDWLTNNGYGALLGNNNYETWRIVYVEAPQDNDGWQALNELHALHGDTDTVADYQDDIIPILNNHFEDASPYEDFPQGENTA